MLRIERIKKSFDTGNGVLSVLDDVSFRIGEGEIVAVLGPSGSGKSTLLEIIAGFQAPDTGKVLMSDKPVSAPSTERAIVFQDDTTFPWLSVADNVAYGLRRTGRPARETRARVEELIAAVGLADFRNFYPRQLSGGMKKRVEFARAFANEPRVVLLDEAFSGLDVYTRRSMYSEFKKIWRSHRPTVILVTHDVEEALLLGDRIVLLTRRPARIQEIVKVDLPPERSWQVVFEPKFVSLRQELDEKVSAHAIQP
jgi:NitT/TauT family transport system ATP-binding protein